MTYWQIPTDLIKVTSCGWKTKCDTNHCRCRKHSIVSDLCSCLQCENNEENQEPEQKNLFSDIHIDIQDDDLLD